MRDALSVLLFYVLVVLDSDVRRRDMRAPYALIHIPRIDEYSGSRIEARFGNVSQASAGRS